MVTWTKPAKRAIRRWADSTKIEGVQEIVESGHFALKIIWTVILCFSIFIFIYQSVNIFQRYLNEESATKISYETFQPEKLPKLIELVYCPADWLDFEKVYENNIDYDLVAFAVSTMISDFRNRENLVLQKLYQLWSLRWWLRNAHFFIQSLLLLSKIHFSN